MGLLEDIKRAAEGLPAVISDKKGLFTVEQTVAERKTFLSRKRLLYVAKFRIDEGTKTVHFSKILKESGFGLSSGSDSDIGTGFGFNPSSTL